MEDRHSGGTMKVVKRTVALAATIGALALTLSACGGHGAGFGPGAPAIPTTSAPTASSTIPEAHRTVGTTTVPTAKTTTPSVTTTTLDNVTMQLSPPVKVGSAAWAASEFVQAYYGVSYTWPNLGYWLVLAKPYLTPSLYGFFHSIAVHADNPGDAAYMNQLRREETTNLVQIEHAGTDGYAPNTADKRYVLVTYQEQALGLDEPQGGAPYGPLQALQCTVVRSRPGAPWQVAKFQYPNAN